MHKYFWSCLGIPGEQAVVLKEDRLANVVVVVQLLAAVVGPLC